MVNHAAFCLNRVVSVYDQVDCHPQPPHSPTTTVAGLVWASRQEGFGPSAIPFALDVPDQACLYAYANER